MPRPFLAQTTTLTSLGIDNFDNVQKLSDLEFTIKKARQTMQEKLKTKDIKRIKRVFKMGITREMMSI